jgi:hypothetical protein
MGKHDPDRVHWAKVLKMISDREPDGIAVYEIATQLGISQMDTHLRDTMGQLLASNKVRLSMGLSDTGMVCRIANLREVEGE